MSKMAKVTIDGKEVKVPDGTNLVDAAQEAGVHIPNLCYIKGMKGVGACRLCLVEVEGGRGHSIACNTRVKDGMVVRTDTDEIKESRKFVIDMILSMHPLDCMTCTKAGVCQLQKYAYDMEVKESTFTRKKFGYPTDEANPFIKRDPEYCIICGRCVRVCEEQGTNVLDFMGRGVGAKVVTENDKPLQDSQCTFCGSCVDACPVNALLEADRWRKGREWEYEAVKSACTLCGNGCEITAYSKDGQVVKVRSGADEGSVRKYICAIGRFGFDSLASDTRLTSPMIKDKGKMKDVTWDEALELAAKKLKAAGKNAGLITNAAITTEDAVAAAMLAKDGLKSQNYESTVSLYCTADIISRSQAADLDAADLVVLVGLDTSQHSRILPALDAAVRKSLKRKTKLVVVNSKDTGMDEVADVKLGGPEAASLKSLAKACIDAGMKADKKLQDALKDAKASDEAAAAAELFSKSDNPVVIAAPSLFDAAQNLSLIKGAAVAAGFEANAKGVAGAGLSGKGGTAADIAGANLKALLVVGEQPSAIKPKTDFLIAVASHKSAITKAADIVLPAAVTLETSGSIVDYLGNVVKLNASVAPPEGVKTVKDILSGIGKALGKDIKASASDIKKAATSGKASALPFEQVKGLESSPEKVNSGTCSSVLETTRMLWLKEKPAQIAAAK